MQQMQAVVVLKALLVRLVLPDRKANPVLRVYKVLPVLLAHKVLLDRKEQPVLSVRKVLLVRKVFRDLQEQELIFLEVSQILISYRQPAIRVMATLLMAIFSFGMLLTINLSMLETFKDQQVQLALQVPLAQQALKARQEQQVLLAHKVQQVHKVRLGQQVPQVHKVRQVQQVQQGRQVQPDWMVVPFYQELQIQEAH
jgi:hypothetical protein